MDGSIKWVVSDERNFLILHPDTLISSTQIAEIVNCVRKAVLDDRIKRAGDSSVAALFGTMMHEVIQTSLRQADFADDFLARETDRVVADRIEQLYFLGQTEATAKAHLAELTTAYKEWAANYLAEYPVSLAWIDAHDREKLLIQSTSVRQENCRRDQHAPTIVEIEAERSSLHLEGRGH
jgi:DNA replication ATP-dependent helicase Dna2